MQHDKIYAIYGHDGAALARTALEQLDVAALIPSKSARIALKPNLVVASPADGGATTHVQVVEGILQYLKAQGYEHLSIIESSWVGDSTKRAYKTCGYEELSRRTGVPLYDLKDDDSVTLMAQGMSLKVCKRAYEADFLINVPVLKAHCQTAFTCALKNLKGIIPDGEKRRYHTLGIHRPVALLNAAIRPHLTVVDALCGDLTFEEGGNPVAMNRLLIGTDSVLLDSYGCSLIGLETDEVEYIGMSAQLGVGKLFTGSELVELNQPQPDTGKTFALSRRTAALTKNVQQDQACSACFGSLVHALNRLDEMGQLSRLKQPIRLGQGFRGQEAAEGLGIGQCCAKFQQFVPGCPPRATDILSFLQEQCR